MSINGYHLIGSREKWLGHLKKMLLEYIFMIDRSSITNTDIVRYVPENLVALGQYLIRQWLGAWWHQAITWYVDLD